MVSSGTRASRQVTESCAGPAGPSRPLRIVHAVSSLTRGGGERLMIDLANDQARDGHSVSIVASAAVPVVRMHQGLNPAIPVTIISKAESSRLRRYADLAGWFWKNRKLLLDADIIHCHMTSGAVLGAMAAANRRWAGANRPAVVETYHAVGMPMPRPMRALHKWMLVRRDAVALMVDHPFREELQSIRPSLLVRVIPAAVASFPKADRVSRLKSRRRYGIPDSSTFVVGTVGRFVRERQPWIYVPIFARIAEAMGPEVTFLMGGDGPELERVRREVADASLQARVIFPGLVTDLQGAFAAMDVFVTLNVGPVPGVAGLQAIAAGLPSVAYQIAEKYGGGEHDALWSSRDVGATALKVIELLRSPDVRHLTGEQQQAHVRINHSYRAMTRGYDDLYQQAVSTLPAG